MKGNIGLCGPPALSADPIGGRKMEEAAKHRDQGTASSQNAEILWVDRNNDYTDDFGT